MLVYVWALEQGRESRRDFGAQDVLVPWQHARPELEAVRALRRRALAGRHGSGKGSPW